jgi:flagellar basal body P-ring formation protein FlgA
MTRIAASLLLAAALFAAAPASGQTLRPAVTITGVVVRLGDLFDGAGSHAADAVVPSPPPGTRITYGADWLAQMAHEHDLAWSPASAFDQVTIVRASRDIANDAIARQMMSAIAARQPVDDAQLVLDNPALDLVVAAEAPETIAVDGLTIDARSGRVEAFVSAPAGDPAATRRRVTGQLVYSIAVPALNHAMTPGTTIAAADLDTIKTRRDRTGGDVVTDARQLIGKTPRRSLQPDVPLRPGDVEMPLLVHKNDLVTIVLETDDLQITTQGQALEDGAQGAQIRVANTKSNRVIDASVTGAGVVTVAMQAAPAAVTPVAER